MKQVTGKRILAHAAFWAFYLIVSTAYYTMGINYRAELFYDLLLLPFPMLFTYAQLYVFIPRLLIKKKIILYILFSFVFGKIVLWLNFLCYNYFINPLKHGITGDRFWYDYPWALRIESLKSVFSFVMICGIAVSIKLLKEWWVEKDRSLRIEKEKIGMELEMLKAQVHPHFLFNTLNNLYALTLTQSPQAPVVVTHLSSLLRYMLYECNAKDVSLMGEIEALKKYIELEKLRYGNRLDISFSSTGNTSGLVIAPLLLFPFVENSFKHGVSDQLEQCWINIHFHGTDTGTLVFNLSNSCSMDKLPPVAGGIGLRNIKKRLELLYMGKYQLVINQVEELYAVKLTLQLNPGTGTVNHSPSFIHLSPATAI